MKNKTLEQALDKLTKDERALILDLLERDPLAPCYRAGLMAYSAVLAFVLLFPFDMIATPTRSEHLPLLHFPPSLLSTNPGYLRDLASNIVYFVPFGFLLAGAWANRMRRPIGDNDGYRHDGTRTTSASSLAATVITAAALFSGTVELAQYWSPTRWSSLLDLVNNVLGAALGLAAFRWWQRRLRVERVR